MKGIILIILAVFITNAEAQKQGNIWYFGNNSGIDFNSGIPVPLTNGQTYSPDGTIIEGSAVISDSTGSLLFYTNGNKVWNKNQQVMPHGDSLDSDFSSTQAALIVAQPGSNRYFYVFTVDDFYEDNLKYGFRYSIVDISLDSCLGDVITNQKNILLLDTVCEKLTGVRHSNGVDYWIIVHKYYSNAFYSYHLSSAGIVDTVISAVGISQPVSYAPSHQDAYSLGYLKASPNGQKLCMVSANGYGTAEYFNFNNNTGIVSNPINLQTDSIYDYYGVSFSPDNSKLYISCVLNDIGLYQFNLNAGSGNADSIIASKIKIAGSSPESLALALGPDGKIYIANCGSYLSVINNPNNLGLSCNYADSAIHLYVSGTACNWGLPNFIDSYSYSNTVYNCSMAGIEQYAVSNNQLLVYPNPFAEGVTIKYYIPENTTNAQVIFYDEFGNQLKTFAVTETGAGQLNITSANLAPGTYSYSLLINGKVVDTKKMVKQQ